MTAELVQLPGSSARFIHVNFEEFLLLEASTWIRIGKIWDIKKIWKTFTKIHFQINSRNCNKVLIFYDSLSGSITCLTLEKVIKINKNSQVVSHALLPTMREGRRTTLAPSIGRDKQEKKISIFMKSDKSTGDSKMHSRVLLITATDQYVSFPFSKISIHVISKCYIHSCPHFSFLLAWPYAKSSIIEKCNCLQFFSGHYDYLFHFLITENNFYHYRRGEC